MADSCFLAKLGHYLELTQAEKRDLTILEEAPEDYSAGRILFEEGEEEVDTLYIVQEGRLHASTLLQDGSRAILKLHFPGDIAGSSNIPFVHPVTTLTTITPARLCRFPRAALTAVFDRHPRIAALFYSIGMLENVALTDRLRSIGRTDAAARIAALILQIAARVSFLQDELMREVDLELTQAEIGDAVGLTQVHVNRMLRELETRRLIARDGGRVTILDVEELQSVAHFTNRYYKIATDWFPPAST
ncbi:MAG: Crp/Fnr family transcriptional regulator [Pseudomonadota bacterium]